MENLVYRVTEDGNARILNEDGTACERFESTMPLVYPVDSCCSCYYVYTDGIVLTIEDAKLCGIEEE